MPRNMTARHAAFGAVLGIALVGFDAKAIYCTDTAGQVLTFCGNTGDQTSIDNSLYTSMGNIPGSENNCLFCHGGGNAYTTSAFNAGVLEQWIMSSYYMPGQSKAYAAWFRTANGTMPPGVDDGCCVNTPVQTFKDKLYYWYFNCVANQPSSYIDDVSYDYIWGTNTHVENGETKCGGGQ